MRTATSVHLLGEVGANELDLSNRLPGLTAIEVSVVEGRLYLQWTGPKGEDDYAWVSVDVREFMPKLAEALMGAGEEG